MGMIWQEVGSMRWPMAFSIAVAVFLTLLSIAKLIGMDASPDLRTKAWIDGVLFWGCFAAISGVLGSLIGVIITLQKIERAGEVTTTLVAGGYKVALLSTSLGLFILGSCALAWFGLQLRWRLMAAAAG